MVDVERVLFIGTQFSNLYTAVDIVEASSHVPLYSLVESTQRVYGVRLFFVSARTNKRHHHHPGVPLADAP
jgi:hypothetical protein